MSNPIPSQENAQLSPRALKRAPAKGRFLAATVISLLAGTLLLGFVTGWVGSRRLYVARRNKDRAYTIQPGDASAEVSSGVKRALRDFQEGYTARDTGRLGAFMDQLFPKDEHILICGTDAGEWIQGRTAAQRFIGGDWTSLGAVRLAIDNPAISASGDAAWLATTGTVTFGKRAQPIRFLAVLEREADRWLFRQIQYQWDEWDARPARLSELVRPSTLVNLHFD